MGRLHGGSETHMQAKTAKTKRLEWILNWRHHEGRWQNWATKNGTKRFEIIPKILGVRLPAQGKPLPADWALAQRKFSKTGRMRNVVQPEDPRHQKKRWQLWAVNSQLYTKKKTWRWTLPNCKEVASKARDTGPVEVKTVKNISKSWRVHNVKMCGKQRQKSIPVGDGPECFGHEFRNLDVVSIRTSLANGRDGITDVCYQCYMELIEAIKEENEGSKNRFGAVQFKRRKWGNLQVMVFGTGLLHKVMSCRFPQRERRQGAEEKSKGHLTQAFDLVRSSRKVPFLWKRVLQRCQAMVRCEILSSVSFGWNRWCQ